MKLSELTQKDHGAEVQRHNRSDSELKQQHGILLSTLPLEQQLHSAATDEHKRHVNELFREFILVKHIGCSNNTILSSNNSCAGIYILELTFEMFYLIIYFNQSIDPRPEYIRVIIIEWSIKSSIPIARIVSLDTQRSLLSARRCKGLYDYSQQTD
ncbi:unnamed protein product [Rotaria magnacalcarata]|uniref:Uncharacterized protein n=2 Tax=Rotaria magnacalcarata TaxID=392030 RepID=A0A816LZH1_9BILA|nr:unnamed protein product [Rotaria magnacalcarata]